MLREHGRLHLAGILLLTTVFITSGISGAIAAPTVTIGRTAAPPVIDGKLDDDCWQNAAVITPFIRNDDQSLPTQQTVGYLLWDDTHLYLGFKCYEQSLSPVTQRMHLLIREAAQRDQGVFRDESIEIFLQPGAAGTYYQLGVSITGAVYDGKGMDATFDADWQAATSATDDAWYAECAIPFASLEGASVSSGDRWAMNIARNQNPNEERSTWSGLQGAFHNPDQFGHIVFADETIPVRLTNLADLSAAATEVRLQLGAVGQEIFAEVLTRRDRVLSTRATVVPGMSEVAVRYPADSSVALPFVRYQVRAADGPLYYRSPWFPQTLAMLELTGNLTLTGSSAALMLNGIEVLQLNDAVATPVDISLSPGENVLSLQVAGGAVLSGTLTIDDQQLPLGRGWRYSNAPEEGWQQAGFRPVSMHPIEDGGSRLVVPDEGRDIALRRVIAVSDRRERFWPLQTDMYLPAQSEMFVKPLLQYVGNLGDDYVHVLDLPKPIRLIAWDNIDGIPIKPLRSEDITRDGKPYTRYHIEPIGTLSSGFTMEFLWRSSDGSASSYVSVFTFGGDFDWRDFEIEITSPPYADLLGVLPLKWQSRGITGVCWYDDISIVEKGTDVNLLPDGDFEGEKWDNNPLVVTYDRDGEPNRACRLSGTREEVNVQRGLWVNPGNIEVKPSTRYVVSLRAKGENIIGQGDTGRATLVADVGNPGTQQLIAYSHYEAMDGHVIEAERASPIHILPPMKSRTPHTVPIMVCYSPAVYENPRVWEANAKMVRQAGINWLWSHNQSELARLLKPHGMNFIWHIPRNQFSQSPVDTTYLERHPDHAAVQKDGSVGRDQICPTLMLEMENDFLPALREWFTESLRNNPYERVEWDHEFPLERDASICFCDRCRTSFQDYAGLDALPSSDEIFENHFDQWIDFRCGLNAKMAGELQKAVKAADPNTPFSVYSGYQTERTRTIYGVDWSMMRPYIDRGVAGYDGSREIIRQTMDALGDVPFTNSCMYVESNSRNDRPYPDMYQWRARLLRAILNDDGEGFMVWYLPVLDGAGYWSISWVAAMVAEYEDFFTNFRRRDSLVQADPKQGVESLAVLTLGSERLVIVINGAQAPRTVTLQMRNLPRNPRLTEYETNRRLDPTQPLQLDLEPGEIRVLHLTSG